MDQVIGHEPQKQMFRRLIEDNQLHNLYLLCGPLGVGKMSLALALAQNLLCERPLKATACGKCGSCVRVQKGAHESLLLVAPEEGSLLIKMHQAEAIMGFLRLSGLGPKERRIIVIDQAHGLGQEATNSLLKSLEEPPPNTHFFLITHRPREILRTVRSRALAVNFFPLSMRELNELSLRHQLAAPGWLLKSSRGSFLKLQQMSLDEISVDRKFAFDLLLDFLESPEAFIESSWRDDIKDRARARLVQRFWLEILRDALCVRLDPSLVLHTDELAVLDRLLSVKGGLTRLNLVSGFVLEMEASLKAWLDPVLVFENFFVRSQHALA